jgi:hypothetical protein
MSDTRKKILEMLAQNKISVDEACKLMNAVDKDNDSGGAPRPETGLKSNARYLRVTVMPGDDSSGSGNLFQDGNVGRVNVRIPLSLIRAGIKLTSLIPPHAYDKINSSLKEKGIDYDIRNLKPEDIEDIIRALGDMQVDVEGGRGEKVRVFVE